jgi:dihydropyrimidine dehydrogenase (NAD+) subunit PreA
VEKNRQEKEELKMAVDLSVDFLGIKFKNPFLLAPTPAARAELLSKAAKAGWGGAVPWTAEITCEHIEDIGASIPHGLEHIEKAPAYWTFGFASHVRGLNPAELYPEEKMERYFKIYKESGMPIIANIVGIAIDSWVKSCVAAERAGADILEVNPSYAIHPKLGMHFGWPDNPDMTRQLIKTIRENVHIPIIVKLNAFLIPEKLKAWAKACVDGGADAISVTNSIPGFSGLDVERGGVPRTAFIDTNGDFRGTAYQICDGPAIKPIGLAAVALIAWEVDVPIIAIGGVSDWYSAVEYFMLGASMVQVGSAAMAYGHGMVRGMKRGLEDFMERKGYKSVKDMVGISNRTYRIGESIYGSGATSEEQPWKMVVDESKCTGCGNCAVTCETSADEAAKVVDGVSKIDQELCMKCCMCKLVCPEHAISMEWNSGYPNT